ncbi:hypothetical protein [Streptomyces capitiformicae]|uniref:Uncharacterized protein n=1 Tax=Streptomyces capitiformicae TaxID=2014920 RepID=A0A918Z7N3_9ACTN|nr:hypothetical protein [Streptomyces capitiformicae]GHE39236.1 hypothetical protein GCM10017771_57940 [Streptomyces capitiformicae]
MFSMVKTLVKTVLAQYVKNQQLKRDLKAQRGEQERQWREEDRAVLQAALAANRAALEPHNGTLQRAAGVSYITLRCHEDTWTFMARTAFGVWEPSWTQSTRDPYDRIGPSPAKAVHFTANPNLPAGRITKADGGMQDIQLSGHNLVVVLDALYEATTSEPSANGARCKTLYDKLASLTAKLDPSAPPGRTTGVLCRIDDSMHHQYVTRPSGGPGFGPGTARNNVRNKTAPLLRKVPSPALSPDAR